MISDQLRAGTPYTIVLEFSEEPGILDGAEASNCVHFMLAVKTWDPKQMCSTMSDYFDTSSVSVSSDSVAKTSTFSLTKKSEQRSLRIDDNGPVDLEIVLDYSDAFYKADLTLR